MSDSRQYEGKEWWRPIWFAPGGWSSASGRWFIFRRIFLFGWRSPFVRVSWRYSLRARVRYLETRVECLEEENLRREEAGEKA